MRSLKLGIIALFLGTISLAGTSFAATDDYQMQPKMHEMMQSCPQYQNLTAEQKAKVDKIILDFKTKTMPLIDQMRTKQVDLDKQFANPVANEAAIHSLAKEISNLRSQIFSTHIQARLDMAKAGFSSADCWKAMHPMKMEKMEKGMGMGPEQGMMGPGMMQQGQMKQGPGMMPSGGSMQAMPSQGLQSGSAQGVSSTPAPTTTTTTK